MALEKSPSCVNPTLRVRRQDIACDTQQCHGHQNIFARYVLVPKAKATNFNPYEDGSAQIEPPPFIYETTGVHKI